MDDYFRAWTVLRGYIRKRTRLRIGLFGSGAEYANWLNSATDYALALALHERDKIDPSRGDFDTWARLKACVVIREELAREERYFELKKVLGSKQNSYRDKAFDSVLHRDELDRAIQQLSPDQQEVVCLSLESDLSNSEIAHVMMRERNAVDALLFRARERLREILGHHLQAEPKVPLRRPKSPSRQRAKARSNLDDEDDTNPAKDPHITPPQAVRRLS